MKCPYCGHNEDRVLDTREQKDGEAIRRRRECLKCKSRFSTVEALSLVFPYIIKKDGRREPYSREKVLKGFQAACQKRPISLSQLEASVDRITTWVINRGEKEIPARLIGQKVMMELRLLDDVAYVRFASVYRTFQDVQEFVETLEDQESFEIIDSNSQLALTPDRLSEKISNNASSKQPEAAQAGENNAPPIARTRPTDPLPN